MGNREFYEAPTRPEVNGAVDCAPGGSGLQKNSAIPFHSL